MSAFPTPPWPTISLLNHLAGRDGYRRLSGQNVRFPDEHRPRFVGLMAELADVQGILGSSMSTALKGGVKGLIRTSGTPEFSGLPNFPDEAVPALRHQILVL